jgi:hypothetical protein
VLTILLRLLERSERLLQIRTHTILDRLRGSQIDHRTAPLEEVGFPLAQRELLRADSHIDADQRSVMPFAQVSQPAGEVL